MMTSTGRLLCAWVLVAGFSLSATAETQIATGLAFHDRNGNQVRDTGEEGLAGIRVSNQREVVATDAEGRWRLPVDDNTTLFVIKPRNWMTPVDPEFKLPRFYYTHKPKGSPRLKYAGVEPTGPLPESIDFPLHPRQEPDKFRALLFGDTQARNEKELEYMAHDVVRELVGFDAAFGVTLGDIAFNDLSIYDQHNRTVALIGIPWYNVIGNHDVNHDAGDDETSDETFERVFGPNYYSFDHGPVHFICLDDVKWLGSEQSGGPGKYISELGEDQLTFVRNDLEFVPEEQLVVLMMHIPIVRTGDRERLYRLIEQRPYTLSISGHTHWQAHVFLAEKDGWRGPKPHHHVINVTVCGSWWRGAPDELGIPHATMRDGAPNGYSVITFDGHDASIEYRAARKPAAYQMNIYAPYTVQADQAAGTEVLANVFGGSERSTVEMQLGPDGDWLPMKLTVRRDPALLAIKDLESGDTPPAGLKTSDPQDCHHMWVAKLPADPPKGLTLLRVRTTDMYGHTYTDLRPIHIK
jgi:hypothetical protein